MITITDATANSIELPNAELFETIVLDMNVGTFTSGGGHVLVRTKHSYDVHVTTLTVKGMCRTLAMQLRDFMLDCMDQIISIIATDGVSPGNVLLIRDPLQIVEEHNDRFSVVFKCAEQVIIR